jgi:hypothetical protein
MVEKGLKSPGGYILGDTFEAKLQVPDFPKELAMLGEGSLLSFSGEQKISVSTRDVAAIQIEVKPLLPGQLQHLVTQSDGDLRKLQFNSSSFNEEHLTKNITSLHYVPKGPHGKTQYTTIDLAPHLQQRESPDAIGVFFITVAEYDPKSKTTTNLSDTRLLLVSDLGFLVKDAPDGSHDVFVQSIASGEAVAAATVQIIGKNGLPVLMAQTGQNGHVHFPPTGDFKREHSPVLYLVRKGRDISFLPFHAPRQQLDLSRFDTGGVTSTGKVDRLGTYVFSDRTLYRPGDEIRIGIIVKPSNWTQNIEGLPVETVITDPRGITVRREKLKLTANGFEELRHSTPDTAPTGTYTINVYAVKDKNQESLLGFSTVMVQEFLPDRMKIAARFSKAREEGWVTPNELTGHVTLQNLFGTPAAKRRIRATLSISPSLPAFTKYKEYEFFDPLKRGESAEQALAEGMTDDNGEAEFPLDLKSFEASTYRLRFLAQGYEAEGGRSVNAEAEIIVSPLPYLVGYKADGNLHYINRASHRNIHFIAVNPELKPVAVERLTAHLLEQRYVSILTKQTNGTYKYESVNRETPVEAKNINLPSSGQTFALNTNAAGTYILLLKDMDGHELHRIAYTVTGDDNVTRSLEKSAELQLLLKKSDYKPGEEIEVQIKAPYAGAGLITIERDRVYQHQWFKSSTTSTVQRIKIPNDFEGTGYVSVSFIRSANSNEIFMSPHSYGVVPFSANHDKRNLKVRVNAPEVVKPGQVMHVQHTTNRPGQIVIMAVEEGILQVAKHKTPDPLSHFFQKQALEVKTAQILDLILPEFKRLMQTTAAPGGDAQGALGQNLNPFKRKRDRPVAFWSGILETGPGEHEVVYRVPDYFNGSLRVMAVAVSKDAVGGAQSSTTVRGDFVISPNVPTFAAPGDEFDVSVTVANNVAGSSSGEDLILEMSASKHVEILGSPRAIMKVASGREGTAIFKVRMKAELGSATLSWTASLKTASATYSTDLSVRPPTPYATSLLTGRVQNQTVDLPLSQSTYPEERVRRISMAALPLSIAHGLMGYLEKFPHGCTEQITSQTFPLLILRNRPDFAMSPKEADRAIQATIATLRSRQKANGAFGLWSAHSEVSDPAFVYAMHFLTEAKERGVAVPTDMMEQGMAYLKHLAESEGHTLGDERVRMYAIYVLTRNGIVTSNYVTLHQARLERSFGGRWRTDLAGIYLAATYKILKQTAQADALIDSSWIGDFQTIDYWYYYDGQVRDAQFLYLLSRHFPERLGRLKIEDLVKLIEPIERGSYNTMSSAMTILALDAYAGSVAHTQLNQKLAISEVLPGGLVRELTFPENGAPEVKLSEEAVAVRLSSREGAIGFYSITQSGFERDLPKSTVSEKLAVSRVYTDIDGKVVTSAKMGDEVLVHVSVRGLSRQMLSHITVVDLLPGGFEVLWDKPVTRNQARTDADPQRNEQSDDPDSDYRYRYYDSTETVRGPWTPSYTDMREDRVVMYGPILPGTQEYVYRIKATNVGKYTVPPASGTSMYDRTVHAQSSGGSITITR